MGRIGYHFPFSLNEKFSNMPFNFHYNVIKPTFLTILKNVKFFYERLLLHSVQHFTFAKSDTADRRILLPLQRIEFQITNGFA